MDNMRTMSQTGVLDTLRAQSKNVMDLLEQERRLHLCAVVVKKKASVEEGKLKRSNFSDKERKAVQHYVETLYNRADELKSRATIVKTQCDALSKSIREELEQFEGAVQDVFPPRILQQVLQWGNPLQRRPIEEVMAPSQILGKALGRSSSLMEENPFNRNILSKY